MQLIWAFLKGTVKFSALAVLGAIVLGLISDVAFGGGTEASGLLGLAYGVYLVLVLIYVIKPSVFRRTAKDKQAVESMQPPEEDVVAAGGDGNLPESSVAISSDTDSVRLDGVFSDIKAQDESFDTLLTSLDREEKFVVMVGLLALYGDGQISEAEISQLRKIIADLGFSPPQVIHRDPSDKDLCLNETLAWALNTIRDDFSGAESLEDEEIEDLFKAFTESIEKDVKNDFPGSKNAQMEYSDKLKNALLRMAEADGNVTTKERKLLSIFKKSSVFQLDARGVIIVITGLAFIAYVIYRAFIALF